MFIYLSWSRISAIIFLFIKCCYPSINCITNLQGPPLATHPSAPPALPCHQSHVRRIILPARPPVGAGSHQRLVSPQWVWNDSWKFSDKRDWLVWILLVFFAIRWCHLCIPHNHCSSKGLLQWLSSPFTLGLSRLFCSQPPVMWLRERSHWLRKMQTVWHRLTVIHPVQSIGPQWGK